MDKAGCRVAYTQLKIREKGLFRLMILSFLMINNKKRIVRRRRRRKKRRKSATISLVDGEVD